MSKSSYYEGQTIAEVAERKYRKLLADATAGSLDVETAAGVEEMVALQFTLSGGGPGSDIVFLLDRDLEEGGEVREGFYSYYESGGTEVVAFGASDGQVILDGLLSEVNEEEPEEDDEEESGLPEDPQCATCGFSPADGGDLDAANDEHLQHDGAHLPRWVTA